MKRIFLALIFILNWSICLAEMPHILKNGDIVDANQLNENFNHNKAGINELSNKISELESNKLDITSDISSDYPTYANGVFIGKSVFSSYGEVYLTFNPDFEPVMLFKTGEIIGGTEAIQFTEFDCTGDRYIKVGNYPSSEYFLVVDSKGRIYRQSSGKRYYYPPKVQTMYVKIPLSYQYYEGGGICHNYIPSNYYLINIETGGIGGFANFQGDGWRLATQEEIDIHLSKIMIKLLPNDPAITGLPNTPFPTPITFDGINEATVEMP